MVNELTGWDKIETEMRMLEADPNISKNQFRLFLQSPMPCGHAVANLLTCSEPPFGCVICNTGDAPKAEFSSYCQDCNRQYGDEHGFPDLIIPYWAWEKISPSGDDGGLLCPSCICKRLHAAELACEGAFMSGPIETVSRSTMNALRRVENIELAIEGRNNRWSDVRNLLKRKLI